MNAIRFFLTAALITFLNNSLPARADDIDLYSGLTGNANIPNVMIVIDNPSSQNNEVGACTYSASLPFAPGGTPSNGSKALGNDQCALANIILNLSTKSDGSALVKLGMTTMSGANVPLIPVDDNAFNNGAAITLTVSGTSIVFAANGNVTIGSTSYVCNSGTTTPCTNRQALILSVMALNQNTGKSGQGSELQETWAYYVGGTGMLSGKTFSGTNAATGCQKNYIIYLSNVKAGASHAQDNGELPYLDAAAKSALTANTLTTAQFNVVDPSSPNYSGTIPNKPEAGYGIEWARFMNTVDTNTTTGAIGTQNIVTYSVGTGDTAIPPAAITNTMEKYISYVASYGGGKYFPAGTSYSALYNDILKILNEVQAVNSVFASASLPVSVNAQGTYLNQIYMGMFRPDANGLPRWLGNLKQYQFVYTPATSTTAASLTLSDSQPISAISSAGTGFISPNAISFWTAKNTGVQPDSGGGFWRNKPQGVGGGYDSPDGEVVEKGGVGQTIRTANLLNNYAASAGTSTNPRKVVTYCPSGSGCVASLLDTTNLFSSTNIPSSSFNPSYIRISSIVRTGTSALVTTSSPHGFSTGTTVTISGATPSDYNVTQSVTVNSTTTFTITGLADYPTTPSQGAYTASLQSASPKTISSISVASSTTANANGCTSSTIPNINCNQVSVTTSTAHGFSSTTTPPDTVTISGVSPSNYSGSFVIANATTNTFTYNVPITPTSPSSNAYSVQRPSDAPISITSVSSSNVLSANNTFAAGDTITLTGVSGLTNGSYTVSSSSLSTTAFKVTSGNPSRCSSNCGTVTRTYPVISIVAGNISRSSATATTATVTGVTASALSNGQTVNLRWVSGTSPNESAYAPTSGAANSVTITCSGTCTSFTFPISTVPSTTALTTSNPTAAVVSGAVTVAAGNITRNGSTVTVSNVPVPNSLPSGSSAINIATSGTAFPNESAYTGAWTINCSSYSSVVGSAGCTKFTFGPVTLTPTSPATGTMAAYSGTAPDTTTIINWVRGMDNASDEPSPDSTLATINVRGSIHGDVLHARPAVINYGGTIGTVVFYGANDGMYRAINGNQTNPSGSSLPAPGSELWSFALPEFIGRLTRQRDNSPVLLLPTTPSGITPTPAKKDYFADGSTGVYQKLNTDGTTNDAYIYLSMRRGGNIIYALHVQDPTQPAFAWKIDQNGLTTTSGLAASTDYAELGQTWSQPKVALVRGYANPVLIFGAGYDPTEDSEPPGTDSMGRGIFILDAKTGKLVWQATVGASDGCSNNTVSTNLVSSSTTCTKTNMKWSIPSDIALIDVNSDGYVDRLYAPDTGGNIWRVDLEPNGYGATTTTNGVTVSANLPSSWKVTQLAALGCATGSCASGTTPRKFFYPPDMVPSASYHAVLIGSGDREHPLYSTSSGSSYNVVNRFYMVKDINIGSSGTDLYTANTEANLKDISPAAGTTTTTYDGTRNGYYLTFGTGEKAVNAATTVAGYTYFATNTPATPTSNSCTTNLGVAKGYAITPLAGSASSFTYSGGGLPPTTVAGVVNVSYTDSNGHAQTAQVPFCLGCGGNPNLTLIGGSAIAGSKPPITVPTNRRKRYWYIENR